MVAGRGTGAAERHEAAEHRVTRLLAVEWNAGGTGTIAPRAVLEPVIIDGVTATYAMLHSPSDITRRGLRLGAQVFVSRVGDVIPRVEAPLVDQRTGNESPVVFPEACPRRGDAIDTTEQRWRCVRGRSCQAVASVIFAVGRDQLDIEGLGGTRATQLVEAGLAKDIADLFTLTREQLLGSALGARLCAAWLESNTLTAACGSAQGCRMAQVSSRMSMTGMPAARAAVMPSVVFSNARQRWGATASFATASR